jgi:hypothetical protein
MKNLKIRLFLFFAILVTLNLAAQLPSGPIAICPGTSGNYKVDAATRHRWVLKDINNNDISGFNNISSSGIRLLVGGIQANWGDIISGADNVLVSVSSSQSPSNFRITSERFRRNIWGTNILLGLGGAWDIGVPTIQPIIAQPTLNDISTNCQCVTFRLTTPDQSQRGVTYQWTLNGIDQAGKVGPQTQICSTTFPAVIGVKASSNCAAPLTATAPSFNPGPLSLFISPQNQSFCLSDGLASVNVSSNQCITSVNWNFDPNVLTLISDGSNGTGGRIATFQFNSNISSFTTTSVSASVNTFASSGSTGSVSINIDPSPNCNPLFTEALKVNGNKVNSKTSKIYPNPTSNSLTIEELTDTETIQVYSILGQLLMQQQVEKEQTMVRLDVSKLQSGSYVVCLVKKDGQLETKKVQIER